jgi:hypothetical protein
MARQAINLEQAREHRMALVEQAYSEFRQKWDPALPPRWAAGEHLAAFDFMRFAESNAQRVPLKYAFPDSVLNDIEII